MVEYERLVTENIQDNIGNILGSNSRKDMMKQINKSKEKARKDLVGQIKSGSI
jgi:hypothetical protein